MESFGKLPLVGLLLVPYLMARTYIPRTLATHMAYLWAGNLFFALGKHTNSKALPLSCSG